MTEVADKLAEFVMLRRKRLGYESRAALASAADISERTITDVERGGGLSHRNRSTRVGLARALQVPIAYLDQVERGLDVEANPPPAAQRRASVTGFSHEPHPSLRSVPILGASRAGHGDEGVDNAAAPVGHLHLPPAAAGHADTFAVEVKGDSMRPHLQPGDFVVCNPAAEEVPGGLYFIQHTGALDDANRLKLVWPVAGDDAMLDLRSTNPRYPAVRVRKEDIGRPALVMYVVRRADKLGIY